MTAPRRKTGHELMRFAHLGILGAVAIAGLGYLGWKLDEWLGSFPYLFLAGALLGAVGWMLIVVREASTLGGARADFDTRDEPPPPSGPESRDERS